MGVWATVADEVEPTDNQEDEAHHEET
jgi:hypothetical protein